MLAISFMIRAFSAASGFDLKRCSMSFIPSRQRVELGLMTSQTNWLTFFWLFQGGAGFSGHERSSVFGKFNCAPASQAGSVGPTFAMTALTSAGVFVAAAGAPATAGAAGAPGAAGTAGAPGAAGAVFGMTAFTLAYGTIRFVSVPLMLN